MIIENTVGIEEDIIGNAYTTAPEPIPEFPWIATANTRDVAYELNEFNPAAGAHTFNTMRYLYNVGYDGGTAIKIDYSFIRMPVFLDTIIPPGSMTYDVNIYTLDVAYASGQDSSSIGGVSKTLISSNSRDIDSDLPTNDGVLETGSASNSLELNSPIPGGSAFYAEGISESYGVLVEFTNFSATVRENTFQDFLLRTRIGYLSKGGYISNNYGIWFE